MVIQNEAVFQNRKHAAYLLGERLREFSNTDSVVVAVPGGGIHMGAYLSQLLGLPLDVIPCKKIKDPANPQKTIGAVSTDAVVLREQGSKFPQNYIYHQIQLLQHGIRLQNKHYNSERLPVPLENKTIIVVDDMLHTGDTMLACVKSLKKRHPYRIVVAVPNVTPQATNAIAEEIDAIVYLTIEPNAIANLYAEFPQVTDEEVADILRESNIHNTQLWPIA